VSFVAVAVAGAAVIGGVASYAGSQVQAGASENATNAQEGMFNYQEQTLAPYQQAGTAATNELQYLEGIGSGQGGSTAGGAYGSLNTPFTASNWKQLSPQYNFQLQQGQQGVLGQASSSQGAESGAALSGLEAYNQNTANSSFNSAFNMYQTQQSNIFNRLSGLAQTGEAASANQATGGSNYAAGIGQSLTNTGTAIGTGISNAGSSVGNAALLGAFMNGQGTNGNALGANPQGDGFD